MASKSGKLQRRSPKVAGVDLLDDSTIRPLPIISNSGPIDLGPDYGDKRDFLAWLQKNPGLGEEKISSLALGFLFRCAEKGMSPSRMQKAAAVASRADQRLRQHLEPCTRMSLHSAAYELLCGSNEKSAGALGQTVGNAVKSTIKGVAGAGQGASNFFRGVAPGAKSIFRSSPVPGLWHAPVTHAATKGLAGYAAGTGIDYASEQLTGVNPHAAQIMGTAGLGIGALGGKNIGRAAAKVGVPKNWSNWLGRTATNTGKAMLGQSAGRGIIGKKIAPTALGGAAALTAAGATLNAGSNATAAIADQVAQSGGQYAVNYAKDNPQVVKDMVTQLTTDKDLMQQVASSPELQSAFRAQVDTLLAENTPFKSLQELASSPVLNLMAAYDKGGVAGLLKAGWNSLTPGQQFATVSALGLLGGGLASGLMGNPTLAGILGLGGLGLGAYTMAGGQMPDVGSWFNSWGAGQHPQPATPQAQGQAASQQAAAAASAAAGAGMGGMGGIMPDMSQYTSQSQLPVSQGQPAPAAPMPVAGHHAAPGYPQQQAPAAAG